MAATMAGDGNAGSRMGILMLRCRSKRVESPHRHQPPFLQEDRPMSKARDTKKDEKKKSKKSPKEKKQEKRDKKKK
jgi:hypothetical protein